MVKAPLLSVYDGQACLGFVLARGPLGFEAFMSDAETSLGVFASQAEAIDQLQRQSEGQE
jgi:hypothetical protein